MSGTGGADELRIGLVGLGKGGPSSYHARSFAMIFNGAPDGPLPQDWPSHRVRVPGARVTAVWDQDDTWAREFAGQFAIADVVHDMEDLIDRVDAVMVLDDITLTHQRRARAFLRAGVPTFIDKPLSTDHAEARELFDLAQNSGAMVMSTSALRFSKEVRAAAQQLAGIGTPVLTVAACQGQYMGDDSIIHYGVHPLELAYAALGPGVREVCNVGSGTTHVVRMRHESAGTVVLLLSPDITQSFRLHVMGTDGDVVIAADDWDAFYAGMLEAFVAAVRTGVPPVSPAETLELIDALIAARDSKAARGAPVKVEPWPGPSGQGR